MTRSSWKRRKGRSLRAPENPSVKVRENPDNLAIGFIAAPVNAVNKTGLTRI